MSSKKEKSNGAKDKFNSPEFLRAVQRGELPVGALKLKEARQYLGGLSIPTMHRLINRGLLKPNRCLRHLIFKISELDRFLSQ